MEEVEVEAQQRITSEQDEDAKARPRDTIWKPKEKKKAHITISSGPLYPTMQALPRRAAPRRTCTTSAHTGAGYTTTVHIHMHVCTYTLIPTNTPTYLTTSKVVLYYS